MMGLTKSKLNLDDTLRIFGGVSGDPIALTNQEKLDLFGGLGDLFGVFRKKEIDPQTFC